MRLTIINRAFFTVRRNQDKVSFTWEVTVAISIFTTDYIITFFTVAAGVDGDFANYCTYLDIIIARCSIVIRIKCAFWC